MNNESFEFYLKGKGENGEYTPNNIPVDTLLEYINDLRTFIIGSEKKTFSKNINLKIEEGSFKVTALSVPLALSTFLTTDIDAISNNNFENVDPKRIEVVEKFQKNAINKENIKYIFKSPNKKTIQISNKTNYIQKTQTWVNVEKYVKGTIVEMGGLKSSNIHIKAKGLSNLLVIDINQKHLEDTKENYLYKEKIIRFTGEQNIITKKLRNLRCKEIKNIPSYDENKLNKLIEKAKITWQGLDSKKWLDELRGEIADA